MTGMLFSQCYYWFRQVLEWVANAWDFLTSPLRDVIGIDLSGNLLLDALLGWIDEVLQVFFDSVIGDWSFLTLVFGSGFSLIMVVNLARFFFK